MKRPRENDAASNNTTFARLMYAFFEKYPDEHLNAVMSDWLAQLQVQCHDFPGKPGAWVGGIFYAIKTRGLVKPIHVILNAELEDLFGVSMAGIRKRATQICDIVEPTLYPIQR
jgi:hypothetical protein